jgi:pilus assembly protein CpaB
MKQKLVPLLGIAFVVALISTGVFYGLFVGKGQSAPAAGFVPSVVVATHSLERGSVIQAADIKAVSWTGPEAPKGSFTTPEQVFGLTVLEAVSASSPVMETMISSNRAVPAGMRAVSIHVTDSSGVVAMLHPGYKVDVQLLLPSEGGRGEVNLRTALQNVEVLTVSPADAGKPVVNLLVSPEDSEMLGLADSSARVRLVLRNPGDQGRVTPSLLSSSSLLKSPAGPASRPPQPVNNPKISSLLPAK